MNSPTPIHANESASRTVDRSVPSHAPTNERTKVPAPAPWAGNQAHLRRVSLQRKSRIGPVDDPLEHEADRVADAVVSGAPVTSISSAAFSTQRKCSACEEEDNRGLQRKCADCEAAAHIDEQSANKAASAIAHGGTPLNPQQRAYFEPRMGHDLSHARLHVDNPASTGAAAIQARAYTSGSHIGFGAGEYRPGTRAGDHLLAHELSHVVQQTSPTQTIARSPNTTALIQRDPAPNPSPAKAPAANPPAGDPAEKDVAVVHDRVQRILVSCEDSRIAFETKSGTHIYPLSKCDKTFPAGDYIADVDVVSPPPPSKAPPSVVLHIDINGKKTLFQATLHIPEGVPHPSDLLKEQPTVPLTYGKNFESSGLRRECSISLPPQTLFGAGGDSMSLTKYLPKVPKLKWPLADFGIGGVILTVGIEATANSDYTYSAAVLDDICIAYPTLKHPFAGHATFNFTGQAHIHLDVTLAAEVDLNILVNVLSAHAAMKLDLDAAVGGTIKAPLIELDYHPKRQSPFSLRTDLELSALVAIAANLSGNAGLEFLGFNLWSGNLPNILHGDLAYGWTGGLSFDDSFVPHPMLGSFAKATPAQLSAGKLRTPGIKRVAKNDDSIPIKELVESWIHGSKGELTADGLSCKNALPIHWFKPREQFYPRKLTFGAPGVSPNEVTQQQGPQLVSHPTVTPPPKFWKRGEPSEPIVGPTPIGVSNENWVETGEWAKCFQYIPSGSSRDESDNFRELLKGLDTRFDNLSASEGRVQMDHVNELQFGGKDQFDNLWPFDASANTSAGALHKKQILAYEKMFKDPIYGRYFRIASVGLDPEKASNLKKS